MCGNLKLLMAGQLRSHRRHAGLTQAELAEKIGRTDEAISNIERGKSLPRLETLWAIAKALNLPLYNFFPREVSDGKVVSVNRLNKEAEAIVLLGNLSESQLNVALLQMRALGDYKA